MFTLVLRMMLENKDAGLNSTIESTVVIIKQKL